MSSLEAPAERNQHGRATAIRVWALSAAEPDWDAYPDPEFDAIREGPKGTVHIEGEWFVAHWKREFARAGFCVHTVMQNSDEFWNAFRTVNSAALSRALTLEPEEDAPSPMKQVVDSLRGLVNG